MLDTEEPWVEGQEYSVTCIAPDAKPAADITLFKGMTTQVNKVSWDAYRDKGQFV